MQRRRYIAGIGSALAAGLAGCLSDSGDGSDGNGGDGSDGNDGTDDGSDSGSDDGNEGSDDGNDGSGDDGSGDDGSNDDGSGDDGDDSDETALVNGSFENELDGWTKGEDLPPKPGEDSGTVEHEITTTTDAEAEASDGDAVLQFTLSGAADDGTLWVEQSVDFTDASAVELDVYSRQKSFNEIGQIAFFAGEKPEDGLVERDFDRSNPTENHDGWKTFSYDVGDLTGTGTLAVGLNIVWETTIVRLYDDVRLVTTED